MDSGSTGHGRSSNLKIQRKSSTYTVTANTVG